MSYQHKENSGTLFINDRKEAPTHADWQGSCNVDGVEYWINEWNVTTDRQGNPLPKADYRKNVRFKRKDAQKMPRQQSMQPDPAPYDDEIPF